jgi:TRAP-type C4-dicarboxylate transport system permease small subunit
MNLFIRIISALSRLSGVIAALMISTAVLVVCQLVFTRYVLGESTSWQTEFVTYTLIAATLIGSPYVLLTRGHVNVDLLPMYLGPRSRFVMAMFASLFSFTFCLFLTWSGVMFWYESWDANWHSDTMWEVRLWIPHLALPVGVGLLSLQYLADILSLLTGRSPPFDIDPEELT